VLEALLPGTRHLQNLHPLFVHFPIGFWSAAAFLYLAAWVARREALAAAALWFLVLGTISAAAAVGTGLWAEPGVMVSRSVREELLEVHERIMLWTSALGAILTLWALARRPWPREGRVFFLLGMLGLAAALARGADYGGRLVYGYNAGGDACPQPIELSE
jgi:uncharacterized membrane protein